MPSPSPEELQSQLEKINEASYKAAREAIHKKREQAERKKQELEQQIAAEAKRLNAMDAMINFAQNNAPDENESDFNDEDYNPDEIYEPILPKVTSASKQTSVSASPKSSSKKQEAKLSPTEIKEQEIYQHLKDNLKRYTGKPRKDADVNNAKAKVSSPSPKATTTMAPVKVDVVKAESLVVQPAIIDATRVAIPAVKATNLVVPSAIVDATPVATANTAPKVKPTPAAKAHTEDKTIQAKQPAQAVKSIAPMAKKIQREEPKPSSIKERARELKEKLGDGQPLKAALMGVQNARGGHGLAAPTAIADVIARTPKPAPKVKSVVAPQPKPISPARSIQADKTILAPKPAPAVKPAAPVAKPVAKKTSVNTPILKPTPRIKSQEELDHEAAQALQAQFDCENASKRRQDDDDHLLAAKLQVAEENKAVSLLTMDELKAKPEEEKQTLKEEASRIYADYEAKIKAQETAHKATAPKTRRPANNNNVEAVEYLSNYAVNLTLYVEVMDVRLCQIGNNYVYELTRKAVEINVRQENNMLDITVDAFSYGSRSTYNETYNRHGFFAEATRQRTACHLQARTQIALDREEMPNILIGVRF
jgi:hypothetical protein